MDVIMLGDTMTNVFNWLKRSELSSDSHQLETLRVIIKETKDVAEKTKQNRAEDPTVPLIWPVQANQLRHQIRRLSNLMEKHDLSKDDMPKNIITSLLGCRCLVPRDTDKVKNDILSMVVELEVFAEDLSKEGRKEVEELVKDDELGKGVKAIGREKEKKEIIDLLMLLQNKNGRSACPVVMITGIRGIGKTTLAKLVCNDKEVEDHFGLPIWFDLNRSKKYDAESIATRVSESAGKDRKRYLLVLDNLENNGSFSELVKELKERGLDDGAILVTTRCSLVTLVVADNTGSKVTPYALHGLSEGETWSLVQQILKDNSRNVPQDIDNAVSSIWQLQYELYT